MPAAVATRVTRQSGRNPQPVQPPAKKAKLSQQQHNARQNGLENLVLGKGDSKRQLRAVTNGVKDVRKNNIDESRATIGSGDGGHGDVDMEDAGKEVVEITSGDEEESDYESEEENADAEVNGKKQDEAQVEDAEMADGQEEGADAETGAQEEPTFGELLQANAPEVVDVEAAFVDPVPETKALAPSNANRALSVPTAASLGTVLTQALRTNDKELLESCFQMNDLDSVRATIERLNSSLVANLLQKLAERLHKRPGRAGNLMVWVQWSLVSHGGYLAGQPEVVKKLGSLNRVIKERASGLQPLLSLKGKLDMLSAQMELRRSIQRNAKIDDEDEDAVIYVEGEEESDEEDQQAIEVAPKGGKRVDVEDFGDSEGSEDEDDEMPTTVNGIDDGMDSEEESEDDEDDMLDDEAEETENDDGDDLSEAEEDEEELDDGEDLSESEEEAPPAKRSTAATRSSGFARRR